MCDKLNKEIERIDFIKRLFISSKRHFRRWIGDDCASLELKGEICISTDSFCEGTHFSRNLFPLYYAGYRGMAAATSDLAASGCRPLAFFLSLGLPEKTREQDFRELLKGIRDFSQEYKVPLGGGDLIRSQSSIFFTITVIGTPFKNFVGRDSIREGDKIYLSSPTGFAHIGLMMLKKMGGFKKSRFNMALRAFLKPKLNFQIPRFLSELDSFNVACIDTSDSLIESLFHLARESSVKIVVRLKSSVIPSSLRLLSKNILNENPLEPFLTGGEDFALLFSLPPDLNAGRYSVFKGIIQLGEAKSGKGVEVFFDGKKINIDKFKPFSHFS